MWHFISEQISSQIETDFICDDIREIRSGDTHHAYRISDGRRRFFVKTNLAQHLELFESESESLQHLGLLEGFKIPKTVCLGIVGEHSFLVLEFLKLTEGNSATWHQLGQQLALMHQNQTQAMYGWQSDNFIGSTPQPNQWHKKWAQFFAEQRIGFMLQLLAEKGHELVNIDAAVDTVVRLLAGHNPTPSMLHGDLWSGNVGFVGDRPSLFDPAIYFGDRETDLAMTELFNRFPNAFYQGYETQWPLDDEYQYRKPIYQLYHVLNHALLFGGNYLESATTLLNNLDK